MINNGLEDGPRGIKYTKSDTLLTGRLIRHDNETFRLVRRNHSDEFIKSGKKLGKPGYRY